MQTTLSERWAARAYLRKRDKLPLISGLAHFCGVCALVNFACAILCTVCAFIGFAEAFIMLTIAHLGLLLLFGMMGLWQWQLCGYVRLLDTKDEENRLLKSERDELLHKLEFGPIEHHSVVPNTRFRE
jgi:hypothetical protein